MFDTVKNVDSKITYGCAVQTADMLKIVRTMRNQQQHCMKFLENHPKNTLWLMILSRITFTLMTVSQERSLRKYICNE